MLWDVVPGGNRTNPNLLESLLPFCYHHATIAPKEVTASANVMTFQSDTLILPSSLP